MDSILNDAVKISNTIPIYWTLTILVCVLGILHSVLYMHKSKVGKQMSLIPGPTSYPIIGVAPFSMKMYYNRQDIIPFVKNLKSQYGNVIGGFFGHQPGVVLCSHSAVTALLRSKEINKSLDYEMLRDTLGDSIFLSKGEKWRNRRRLIAPTVNSNRVFTLNRKFQQQARTLTNILREDLADGKKYFDAEPYIARCFLDLAFEGLTGRHLATQTRRDSTVVNALQRLIDRLPERAYRIYLRPNFMWKLSGHAKAEKIDIKILREFIHGVIEDQRQGERSKDYLIDVLLDWKDSNGIGLSNQDIIDEILTALSGARDTSTRGTLLTLWLLTLHPEEYKKVMAELDEFIFRNGGEFKKVESEDLKYLECCINESMRLFTPGIFLIRTNQDDFVADNTVIPKGSTIVLNILTAHRDPSVFNDPESFKPERFLGENDAKDIYIFSGGRRSCPGQKFGMVAVKTVMTQILSEFTVSSYKTMEDMKFTIDMLLKPTEPIPLRFTPRQK